MFITLGEFPVMAEITHILAANIRRQFFFVITVPDHVTFLNQVTYSGNLVQTELPIERKPNQITFG